MSSAAGLKVEGGAPSSVASFPPWLLARRHCQFDGKRSQGCWHGEHRSPRTFRGLPSTCRMRSQDYGNADLYFGGAGLAVESRLCVSEMFHGSTSLATLVVERWPRGPPHDLGCDLTKQRSTILLQHPGLPRLCPWRPSRSHPKEPNFRIFDTPHGPGDHST